jgi:type II secretory pathway component HofQ
LNEAAMTVVPKLIRSCLTAALALMLASSAHALGVGRILIGGAAGQRVVTVETQGLAQPSLEEVAGRLVIVIPGGQRAMKTLRVGSDPVRQIRFGSQDGKLRVVLDLDRQVKASLGAVTAKGFTVNLGPATGAPPRPRASQEAGDEALSPALAGYTYSLVDLNLGGDKDHSELVISANGPASYRPSVREGGRLISLSFRNSSLAYSGALDRLSDDVIESVSARQLSVGGESQVRVDVRLRAKADYALQRDQNQVLLRLARPPREVSSPSRGKIDARVSVEVQNADLVGVLKTLCEQAGFEFQFSRDMLSKTPPDSLVTIKVVERPFREVIDALLAPVASQFLQQGNTLYFGSVTELDEQRNRLPLVNRTYSPRYITVKQAKDILAAHFKRNADRALGTSVAADDPRDASRLLLVGTSDDVSRVLAALARYDVPESGEAAAGADAGSNSIKTQVFRLQYLDATQHGALITAAIAQLYGEGETAPTPYIDPNTRTLVVTTQLKNLRRIERLLARLDVRPSQVNIEARIVEVNQSDGNLLGIDWTGSTVRESGLVSGGNPVPEAQASFNPGIASAFTSQLNYATIASGMNINARIQALVDSRKAELVSSPNITVRDNSPATISVTDRLISVETTTTITNGIATVATASRTQDVPLSLLVLPRLSMADRRILMNVTFNLTTPTGPAPAAGAEVPTTAQTATTEVSVNSGDTAVIGGLVRQNIIQQQRKVPILGDIPLLGMLFKFDSDTKEKKEVIIFITPSIVED